MSQYSKLTTNNLKLYNNGNEIALNSNITSNSNNINNETTRATASETSLKNIISTEINRDNTAKNSLERLISQESSRSVSSENILSAEIISKQNRATGVESILTTAISTTEYTRATSIEISISRFLSTFVSGATNTLLDTIGEIASALSSETIIDTITSNISNENVRAIGSENIISSEISIKLSNINISDLSFNSLIDGNILRANSVETILSNRISNEISRARSNESILSTAISNKVNITFTPLENSLSSEITRARSTESQLSSSLTTINNNISCINYGPVFTSQPILSYTVSSENINNVNNVNQLGYTINGSSTNAHDLTGTNGWKQMGSVNVPNGVWFMCVEVKYSQTSTSHVTSRIGISIGMYDATQNEPLANPQSNTTDHSPGLCYWEWNQVQTASDGSAPSPYVNRIIPLAGTIRGNGTPIYFNFQLLGGNIATINYTYKLIRIA